MSDSFDRDTPIISIHKDTFIKMDGCGKQPQVVRFAAAGYWPLIF
jgi:hypothetical protein